MSEKQLIPQPRFTAGTIGFILFGPILWAAHFLVIYGSQSSWCALDTSTSTLGENGGVTSTIVVATLIVLAFGLICAVFTRATYRTFAGRALETEQWPFLQSLMRILTGLSLLAVAYAGVAALILPACAQMR